MDEYIDGFVSMILWKLDLKVASGKWKSPMRIAIKPLLRLVTVFYVLLVFHLA